MCYSKEQSKQSFIINIITCYILYNYSNSSTYKILALFFGFVGIMQLLDIIFWTNQNINESEQARINYITTKIAMIINHLQPIILAYLIYKYKHSLGKYSQKIIVIYTIAIIIYSIDSYNKIKYTLQEKVDVKNINKLLYPNSNDNIRSSLKWEWNLQNNNFLIYTIFLITLVILSYENFNYPFNIILAFINVFTFILSAHFYKGQSLGRFWCKIAAWIPLFFIILNKFIK